MCARLALSTAVSSLLSPPLHSPSSSSAPPMMTSPPSRSKRSFRSTVTVRFDDQRTRCPLLSLSLGRISARSGGRPVTASYGVLPPSAFVDVRFFNQTAWFAASPHKY
ncbi:hypothetical protein OG21DRAFT_1135374 [Imleria badia]|nr:hypothetical protein OG21DRAFT_1135374 [Imleria badia]